MSRSSTRRPEARVMHSKAGRRNSPSHRNENVVNAVESREGLKWALAAGLLVAGNVVGANGMAKDSTSTRYRWVCWDLPHGIACPKVVGDRLCNLQSGSGALRGRFCSR